MLCPRIRSPRALLPFASSARPSPFLYPSSARAFLSIKWGSKSIDDVSVSYRPLGVPPDDHTNSGPGVRDKLVVKKLRSSPWKRGSRNWKKDSVARGRDEKGLRGLKFAAQDSEGLEKESVAEDPGKDSVPESRDEEGFRRFRYIVHDPSGLSESDPAYRKIYWRDAGDRVKSPQEADNSHQHQPIDVRRGQRRALIEQEDFHAATSKLKCTISIEDLQLDHPEKIGGFKASTICSYNWDQTKRAMYVPGEPPKYKRSKEPSPHIAISSRTEEVHKSLWHQLPYALEAINVMNPTFDFTGVDVVLSSNCINALFNWARQKSPLLGTMSRAAGQTVFIDLIALWNSGSPKSAESFLRRSQIPGHDLLADTTHIRWFQYQLGELNVAVMVDVDSWTPTPGSQVWEPLPADTPVETVPATLSDDITLTRLGRDIPRDNLTQLRFGMNKPLPQDVFTSMFFDRVPTVISGKLEKNKFGIGSLRAPARVEALAAMTRWRAREHVPRLHTLLKKLRSATLEAPDRALMAISPVPSTAPTVNIYEPELDPAVLDARGVYGTYRTPPTFLGKDVEERFWPADKLEERARSRASKTKAPTPGG